MDGQRFDGIARRLATETSRRQLLRGVAGAAGSLLALRTRGIAATAASTADCAQFCRQLPAGKERGQCVADAAAGTGLCFRCGPASADPTQQWCGGVCVDTGSDPQHCGACGAVCATGEMCDQGACLTPCPSGFTACDGVCVALSSDVDHCGGCGQRCAFTHAGASCDQGSCTLGTCASGWGNCNADAIDGCETDLTADPNNCGGCGVVCPTPANGTATCTDERCGFVCAAGFTACGEVCVDLQRDPDHCGACGSACPQGANCSGGSCACPAETPDVCPYWAGNGYADRCVNLQNDNDNCGGCLQHCVDETCRGGQCRGATGQTCYDLDNVPGEDFCYTGQCVNVATGADCTDPFGTVETCVCT